MDENDGYTEDRRRLVREVEAEMADTADWTGRDRLSPPVAAALASVPRHRFVDEDRQAEAYANRPLPIGHGQTISQPFIVALMTDLCDLDATSRVLEIGTGCGYQTAMLAEVAAEVHTVEVVPELARRARRTLEAIGYGNIGYRIGDGRQGWPEAAPFDAIIVTAAPETIPPAFGAQLKDGGRLVIPVGGHAGAWSDQKLQRCLRRAEGTVDCDVVLPVAFVPLTGR